MLHVMILNQSSSEPIHELLIMQCQCVHFQLNMDGVAEHPIKNGSNTNIRRAGFQKDRSITTIGWTAV